jgi:uncharacterized membrane protein YhfC
MFFGIIGFVLFVMVLERMMHSVVLKPDENGVIPMMEEPWNFVLYGIFAAGLFEETARFISFIILRSNHTGIKTGLAYGIGHGGAESILLVGLTMVNNLILSVMINYGDITILGDSPQMLETMGALVNATPYVFMFGGIERIITIACQISLSVIVWYSLTGRGRLWLFPAAILLHAISDIPAAMMQAGLLTNMWMVEGALAVGAFITITIAYKIHRRLDDVYDFTYFY